MKNPGLIVGLAAWVLMCLAGLYVLNLSNMRPFDPDLRLNSAIAEPDFSQNTQDLFQQIGVATEKVVIHLASEDCVCSDFVSRHQNKIDSELAQMGFSSQHLNLDSVPALASLLPSSPAIAIFDENQQLLYLGPYSSGLGCFGTVGPVNGLIDRMARQSSVQPLYISESSGCYCAFEA